MATSSHGWVVDASVAAKWHLRDEDHLTEATMLLREFMDGSVSLAAPSLIRYEVGNALELARRSGRIDASEVEFQLNRLLTLAPHQTTDDDALVLAASRLAGRYGIEIYDGVYLALSELLEIPMITADAKLYSKVGGILPYLVWLGDLKTSS